MARIRTIKPEFWGSPDVAKLSRDARLLLIGIMSMADDDGRFLAAPTAINGFVFPNDDVSNAKISRWLAECSEGSEPVHLYESNGVHYGVLPNWHKHQVINRYTPSRLPAPDLECYPRARGKGESDAT